jgi:LmbE family N-acetylglucosaminyl deacetylase
MNKWLMGAMMVVSSWCSGFVLAQSSASVLLGLQKLNTVGSVLYVAAHPDDENTRLLSYLANEHKLRTGYLSITRGDGGQNLIGKEQGELLGIIRTNELLAARNTDGAEQFFTRANDFGFSKNPEETLAFWNKDSTLADMVWVIRNFKPDVIINRFPTTGEGGHGHHTASAILALEAFEAAANPAMFPEQLKYTQVWQAKRLFWNTFNFGTTNTTANDQLKIDVGGFNPLLGKSYGEVASESRSMHKSQGFGTARQRGEITEYFKQLKGEPVSKDLFEGIDQSWKRMPQSEAVQQTLSNLLQQFSAAQPSASVQGLVSLYIQISALPETTPEAAYWKKQKRSETERLIVSAMGLWVEATVSDYTAVAGDSILLNAQVINRSTEQVKLERITFTATSDTAPLYLLKPNELFTAKRTLQLPQSTSTTNPYWLNEKHSLGRYVVQDMQQVGVPINSPALEVVFELTVQGTKLRLTRGVTYKATDPVKGEVYRPFEVLPPATVNLSEKVYVFSGTGSKTIQLRIKAHTRNVKGKLVLTAGEGWTVAVNNPDFSLKEKGEEQTITATLTPTAKAKDGRLTAALKIGENTFTKSLKRIEYDHIPYQFLLSYAEANVINIDLKKTGTRIGYIPGAGDEVAACLKEVGYEVTELTEDLLATSDLSVYSAIVCGIRAYNTNEKLQVHYPKLMDYVKGGGNLVAQYNTNNRIGPLLAKLGPYPFTISRDRVTDETAPITFVRLKHPALNLPNVISPNDFEGWVQERGIYFATEVDSNYTTVLLLNDSKEKPSEGSLIVAPYGKGNFVYTGLAFFRQLPAGVPGAYRLFVNLLSLPKNN